MLDLQSSLVIDKTKTRPHGCGRVLARCSSAGWIFCPLSPISSEEFPEINTRLLVGDRTIDLVDDHIDVGIRGELPNSAVRNSEYAPTRASSEKLLLRPLGLGRTQAIVPAHPVACWPHSTFGWPIMVDKARFPRKAIERGA